MCEIARLLGSEVLEDGMEGREVERAWWRSWVVSAVTIATRAPESISGRKAVGMSWP